MRRATELILRNGKIIGTRIGSSASLNTSRISGSGQCRMFLALNPLSSEVNLVHILSHSFFTIQHAFYIYVFSMVSLPSVSLITLSCVLQDASFALSLIR
jgi:hypothetical protein